MTNSDESTGSVAPGLSRRRFLQATGLGAAAAAAAGLSGGPAAAADSSAALPAGWSGTIRDVKHVVILMQENRSFDHYFGTLRGVRGFGDKQILTYANGTSSGFITNPDDYTVDFGPDAGTAEVTTYPELLPKAGVSWRVYTNDQVGDSGDFPDFFLGDFGDNPLWFHQQYNTTNSRDGGTGVRDRRPDRRVRLQAPGLLDPAEHPHP